MTLTCAGKVAASIVKNMGYPAGTQFSERGLVWPHKYLTAHTHELISLLTNRLRSDWNQPNT